MLQIYQIITIWKYLNKLFLFTSQKRQNKRGHFKASFYSSPLFYPIAPTKPIVQLIRAYFTPISSMQNNQCEVLYPNCEPTSHFSPSFQSKMRSKWEALWFFVFLPVLLYLLYINIIRVIGFTFRISSYIIVNEKKKAHRVLRHTFLQLRYSPVKSVVFCICLFNMMLCFKGRESGQMRTERTPDIFIFRAGDWSPTKWQNKSFSLFLFLLPRD